MLAYCALAQRSPVPLACLQDAASLSNSTQYNAALGVSSIKEWMPHDVAEWLYMQSTKEDYTHTFLVHNIDGPALLGLTREQMLEWKVKHADVQVILKGVVDLHKSLIELHQLIKGSDLELCLLDLKITFRVSSLP